MKTKVLAFAAIFAASSLILAGCSKIISAENIVDEEIPTIIGSSEFFSSLACINNTPTKAGEASLEEIIESIQPLFASAKEYLSLNGYNYLEDFEENDPNIILTAYALMEADFNDQIPQTKITVSDAVSCVFLGEAVGNVSGTAAALLAKRFAKKILMRAVPYVGTAAAVVSAGVCLYENW